MYTYTSTHHVTLHRGDDDAPLHLSASYIRRQLREGSLITAAFSAAYRGHGLGPEYQAAYADDETTDDWLAALMYWPGYQQFSPVPVFFADHDRVCEVYQLLEDRPVAWMFALTGYQRPRGNPPHGIIFPALAPSSGHTGVNAYAVAQVNMTFALLAMQSPGIWHRRLCDVLGIPRLERKTMTFKGNVMRGELVPRRLSEREPILRPVTRRNRR